MPRLKAEYFDAGKARFFFKHLPLPIHARAMSAAISAECAQIRGKFWDLHDWMFLARGNLEENAVTRRISEIGLDEEEFTSCLADASIRDRVVRDLAEATRLGIRSTPTVLIGPMDSVALVRVQQVVSGARNIQDFVSALDAAIATVGR
jgi:protein-disulfide isomerase